MNWEEKQFPARDDALPEVMAFVEGVLEAVGCPMKTVIALSVAVEEIFVNISHYAYPEKPGVVWLKLGACSQTRQVSMEFRDGGIPFDPLQKADPDISQVADERQIGGLGIFIVKKTMDSLSYRYENEENILTMNKSF